MTTWPSDRKASTQYTDQSSDRIADARAEINQTIANVNDIIDYFDVSTPSNGDLMRYNSTSGAWESVGADSISSQSLYIPMGGFVVNRWSQDGGTQAQIKKFYQICTLGGPVIRRHLDTTVQSAESVYGSIENATVNRPTPTVVAPSGEIRATNIRIILTDGIRTLGTGDAAQGTGSARLYNSHLYGTGYDNYVQLPAGTYRVSFLSNEPDADLNYNKIFNENTGGTGTTGLQNLSTLLIYNETDNTDLGTVDQLSRLTEEFVFFTLANTARIKFYSSDNNYSSGEPEIGLDGLGVRNDGGISGVLTGWLADGSDKLFFGTDAASSIPSKLGTFVSAANRYIRIDKL
jgi:hypothetical protein